MCAPWASVQCGGGAGAPPYAGPGLIARVGPVRRRRRPLRGFPWCRLVLGGGGGGPPSSMDPPRRGVVAAAAGGMGRVTVLGGVGPGGALRRGRGGRGNTDTVPGAQHRRTGTAQHSIAQEAPHRNTTGRRRTWHSAQQHSTPRTQQRSATAHRRTPQETAQHTGTQQGTGRQKRHRPNKQHNAGALDHDSAAQHRTVGRGQGRQNTTPQNIHSTTHSSRQQHTPTYHGKPHRAEHKAQTSTVKNSAGGHDTPGRRTKPEGTT